LSSSSCLLENPHLLHDLGVNGAVRSPKLLSLASICAGHLPGRNRKNERTSAAIQIPLVGLTTIQRASLGLGFITLEWIQSQANQKNRHRLRGQ
jgi:hypothetical protein